MTRIIKKAIPLAASLLLLAGSPALPQGTTLAKRALTIRSLSLKRASYNPHGPAPTPILTGNGRRVTHDLTR
jgi:hypothetical protein